MTLGGITISISTFLLMLCALALVLLIRLRGFGPAVLIGVLLSVVGTVSFLNTFNITV